MSVQQAVRHLDRPWLPVLGDGQRSLERRLWHVRIARYADPHLPTDALRVLAVVLVIRVCRLPLRIFTADPHVKISATPDHARRIDALCLRIALQVDGAARMHARHFPGVYERTDLVPQVRPPVKIMLPEDARHAGMSEDLRIHLLNLPVVRKGVVCHEHRHEYWRRATVREM